MVNGCEMSRVLDYHEFRIWIPGEKFFLQGQREEVVLPGYDTRRTFDRTKVVPHAPPGDRRKGVEVGSSATEPLAEIVLPG